MRAAVLRARGENCVQQTDRSNVGSAERGGLRRGDENFVALADERGKVGVRDADAVGAVGARLLNAFDGLAKAATEGDGHDQILFGDRANELRNTARGSSGDYGQPWTV